ncbi:MAG: type II toxin-antitoxin system HicB family antitoxin [Dehalococcoidia bacterium]|nr:type II toxin-antitoxin system HicB family antitoxin [Dehalococcoidia bacterium]
MKEVEYVIIIHPDDTGGYWTEVPALPGCGSQGETVEEAVAMTKDAIQCYLVSLKRHGEPIPEERDIVLRVSVAA